MGKLSPTHSFQTRPHLSLSKSCTLQQMFVQLVSKARSSFFVGRTLYSLFIKDSRQDDVQPFSYQVVHMCQHYRRVCPAPASTACENHSFIVISTLKSNNQPPCSCKILSRYITVESSSTLRVLGGQQWCTIATELPSDVRTVSVNDLERDAPCTDQISCVASQA